jgi:hypothetical protein
MPVLNFDDPLNSVAMMGKTIIRPCEPFRKDIRATHWKSEEVTFKREPGVEYEIYRTNPTDVNANTLFADVHKRRLRKITTFKDGEQLMEKIENDYPIPESQWEGLMIRTAYSSTGASIHRELPPGAVRYPPPEPDYEVKGFSLSS